jgi:hypothetical protein
MADRNRPQAQGRTQMKGSHYTVDSPAVREILSGVYKNATRNYFKIAPDGRCEVFAVRTQLMASGMGSTSASKILDQAHIPAGTFVLNPSVKLEGVTVIRADVEVYGVGPLEEEPSERDDQGRWIGSPAATIVSVGQDSIGNDDDMLPGEREETAPVCSVTEHLLPLSKPVKKNGPKALTEEEREEKLARQEEAANSKRYQYIETSSGKFGIWDGANGYTVFLAYTKEEAIEEMSRLQTGKSCTVTYTGGSRTTRPGITY